MPQTIGAFLALSTVMMFALNYQQSAIRGTLSAVNSEMEVMANAVAAEAMQYIASKPFDAKTADKTVTENNANTAQLTPVASFGFDGLYADANDLDDFHAMKPDTVWFATSDTQGFNFTVNASVRYVDDLGMTSMTQTWIKEVTVTVNGPESGTRKLLFHPVALTRQFSPLWY